MAIKSLVLSKDDVELLHESLWHLYLEYDRESQAKHVNTLPELKKIFKNKKDQAKFLLERIENCSHRILLKK